MESLLKDTPNKGHHRKYFSNKDTFGGTKNGLSYCHGNFGPGGNLVRGTNFTGKFGPPGPFLIGKFGPSLENLVRLVNVED